MTKSNQQAYNDRKNVIDTKLEIVKSLLDEHANKSHTWASVGDLGHVNDQLDEIIEFLRGYNE